MSDPRGPNDGVDFDDQPFVRISALEAENARLTKERDELLEALADITRTVDEKVLRALGAMKEQRSSTPAPKP